MWSNVWCIDTEGLLNPEASSSDYGTSSNGYGTRSLNIVYKRFLPHPNVM